MAEVARVGAPAAAFSSRPRTVRIAGGAAPSPYPSTSSRPTRCPRRRRGLLLVPFGCRAPTEASSPWPLLDAVEDDPDPIRTPEGDAILRGRRALDRERTHVARHGRRERGRLDRRRVPGDGCRASGRGAVYAECWPEGEGEGKPTRWRRIADRKIVAKGAPHPRHRPASSSSPSRDHLQSRSFISPLFDSSTAEAELTRLLPASSPRRRGHTRAQAPATVPSRVLARRRRVASPRGSRRRRDPRGEQTAQTAVHGARVQRSRALRRVSRAFAGVTAGHPAGDAQAG